MEPKEPALGKRHTHIEIERKFLVTAPPELSPGIRSFAISQGYITSGGVSREVRVRRIGDVCTLGVKSGGGVEREETEIELSATQFEKLWPLTSGRRLEKRRYLIETPGQPLIELDVYMGHLEGLVVAEVEFDSREECDSFVAPAWFDREISEDTRYKNSRLAHDGLP